jgi:hypothetical protein
MRRHASLLTRGLGGIVVAILLAGCNVGPRASVSPEPSLPVTPPGPTPSPGEQLVGTVRVTDTGCDFQPGPQGLHEGPARLEAVNSTSGFGGAHLWRILAGKSYDDLAAYVQQEVALAESGQPGLGPPAFVGDLIAAEMAAPGIGSGSGVLRSGTYAIVCARHSAAALEPRPFAIIGPIQVE